VGLVSGLGRRGHAERAQQQVAHGVEEVHQRLGREIEGPHWGRQGEHDRGGAGDRQALRRQLTDDDVQRGDDQERERRRQPEAADRGRVAEHRLEQVVEGRLPERAQTKRGHRDPELTGRQVGIDVVDSVRDRLGARPALAQQLPRLRRPQARDRELDRDEEPVRRHQHEREDKLAGHQPRRP
jgi:hypothetical protein